MPGPESFNQNPSDTQTSNEIVREMPTHSELMRTHDLLEHKKKIDFDLTGVEKTLEREKIGLGDFHKMAVLNPDTFDANQPRKNGPEVFIQKNGVNERGNVEATMAIILNNGRGDPNENTVFIITGEVVGEKFVTRTNAIIQETNQTHANELFQADLKEKDAKQIGRTDTYLTMQLFRGKMTVTEYKRDVAKAHKGIGIYQLHDEEDLRNKKHGGTEYLRNNAAYEENKELFVRLLLNKQEEVNNVINATEEELRGARAEREEAERLIIEEANKVREGREALKRAQEELLKDKEQVEQDREALKEDQQRIEAERDAQNRLRAEINAEIARSRLTAEKEARQIIENARVKASEIYRKAQEELERILEVESIETGGNIQDTPKAPMEKEPEVESQKERVLG